MLDKEAWRDMCRSHGCTADIDRYDRHEAEHNLPSLDLIKELYGNRSAAEIALKLQLRPHRQLKNDDNSGLISS